MSTLLLTYLLINPPLHDNYWYIKSLPYYEDPLSVTVAYIVASVSKKVFFYQKLSNLLANGEYSSNWPPWRIRHCTLASHLTCLNCYNIMHMNSAIFLFFSTLCSTTQP